MTEPVHESAAPPPVPEPGRTPADGPAYAEATVLDWPLVLLVGGVLLSVVVGVLVRASTGGFLLGGVLLACGGMRLAHRGRRPQSIAVRSWRTDVVTAWLLALTLVMLSYLLRHYLGS